MPELMVELEIAASPDRVWAVLTDFQAYDDWHPYQSITGKPELFSALTITSRMLGADVRKVTKAKAIVWKFDPGKRLELLSGRPFIASSRRIFLLLPHAKGTLVRHGVKFSGFWAARQFAHDHKIERLQPYYEAFGKALARRVASSPAVITGSGNRHSRRASKSKGRQKS